MGCHAQKEVCGKIGRWRKICIYRYFFKEKDVFAKETHQRVYLRAFCSGGTLSRRTSVSNVFPQCRMTTITHGWAPKPEEVSWCMADSNALRVKQIAGLWKSSRKTKKACDGQALGPSSRKWGHFCSCTGKWWDVSKQGMCPLSQQLGGTFETEPEWCVGQASRGQSGTVRRPQPSPWDNTWLMGANR